MLVISLRVGEVIEMTLPTGERVEVKLTRLCPDRRRPVELGFTAPRHVPIERSEIVGRAPKPAEGGVA